MVQTEENAEQHCGGTYIVSFGTRERISFCLQILYLKYKMQQVVGAEHEKNSFVKKTLYILDYVREQTIFNGQMVSK